MEKIYRQYFNAPGGRLIADHCGLVCGEGDDEYHPVDLYLYLPDRALDPAFATLCAAFAASFDRHCHLYPVNLGPVLRGDRLLAPPSRANRQNGRLAD